MESRTLKAVCPTKKRVSVKVYLVENLATYGMTDNKSFTVRSGTTKVDCSTVVTPGAMVVADRVAKRSVGIRAVFIGDRLLPEEAFWGAETNL